MGKPLPFSFCRQCGVTHEPGKHRARALKTMPPLVVTDEVLAAMPNPAESLADAMKPKRGRPRTSTPEQRREYLKLKARERRARQKAAKGG